MSFAVSEEQDDLRSVVRDFLAERAPQAQTRRLMATDTGHDPAVWAALADQLGLVGLAVPEEYGGAGGGWLELGVVFEEMGRALLCAPYFATVALAIPALLASGDAAAAAEHLPAIVAGERIATLAVPEPGTPWDRPAADVRAEEHGGGWRLHGGQTHVPDGALADLVLVAARSGAGPALFAVEGTAPGLTRRSLPTLDQTRKQAELRFDGVPARLVGRDGAGRAPVEQALRLAAVALAAEQVGAAEAAMELAVEHAKVRTQFGRPIGSFQAVKHMCAEMLLLVESARSAAQHAMWTADHNPDDLAVAASLARAFCTDAVEGVCARCIQVHGGIGFTWEHPAHLYFKRASSSAALLGDADHHRAVFADLVLPT